MFLTHTQHGMGVAILSAVRQHRTLGITLIIAGFLRAAETISGASTLALLWPLAMLAAAAQLISYREPEGAWIPVSHCPRRMRKTWHTTNP